MFQTPMTMSCASFEFFGDVEVDFREVDCGVAGVLWEVLSGVEDCAAAAFFLGAMVESVRGFSRSRVLFRRRRRGLDVVGSSCACEMLVAADGQRGHRTAPLT